MSTPPLAIDRVARSQRILLAAQVFRLAMFVVTTTVLGRYLAPGDFGFVALVSTMFLLTTELLDIGTSAAVTRRIAQGPSQERATLDALLTWRRVAAGAIAVAVAAAVAVSAVVPSAFGATPQQRTVLLVVALLLPWMSVNTYHIVFQTRQAFGRAVLIGLVVQSSFLLAVGLVLVVADGRFIGTVGLGAVIALLVVAREMAQVFGSRLVAVRLLGYPLKGVREVAAVVALLRNAGTFGLSTLAYRLSAVSGPVLVWMLASPEATGQFTAAHRLIGPLTDISWTIATPLIAALSVVAVAHPPALRARLAATLQMLIAVAALIVVGGQFVAAPVLELLYGARYVQGPVSAVATLRWLCVAAAFAIVTPVLATSCLAQGRDRLLLATALVALAVGLVGNGWLVPRQGPTGAAVMLCVSEGIVMLTLLVAALRRRDVHIDRAWLVAMVPAASLFVLLGLLAEWPFVQLATCAIAVPLAVVGLRRTPRQRAWRELLASGSPGATA